jgi:DNA-binding CsgD family transcriptional regulator
MIAEQDLDHLRSLVMAAAVDPRRWADFVAAIARAAPGAKTHFIGHDLTSNETSQTVWTGYDDAYITAWLSHFHKLNPWAAGLSRARIGVPMWTRDMCATDAMIGTEFYHDWLQPQGNIVAGSGILLARDSTRFIAIGGNISTRDEDRLETSFHEILQRLGPLLVQAVEINRDLAQVALERDIIASAAPPARAALLLVDRTRRVRFANTEAHTLLAAGRALQTDHVGRLLVGDTLAQDRLKTAVERLACGALDMPAGFVLHQPCSGSRLICRFVRYDIAAQTSPFAWIANGLDEPCLLIVASRTAPLETAAHRVADMLQLTMTEAGIAVALAIGDSPQDIATKRGTSLNTVRNQLKSALAKTGQRNQAGLVRLVIEIAGI